MCRAGYFQIAYSSAPAMVMRTLGAGSKYPFTTRNAKGEFLNGSNSYKLHLPPHPPAALFWAVTAYDITDGAMPEMPQLLPSINGFNMVARQNHDPARLPEVVFNGLRVHHGRRQPPHATRSNRILDPLGSATVPHLEPGPA